MPELTEVRMLQVEPQAAESDLQQDDVAALWPDGGLPAPSQDFHQQSVTTNETIELRTGALNFVAPDIT